MNKIIFLDIDGVLNCQNDFKEQMNYSFIKNDLDYYTISNLSNIDYNKLYNLLYITQATNAKIVVTSSWARTVWWDEVAYILRNYGLPIIDSVVSDDRYDGIKDYLNNNQVDHYIILDDELFNGFENDDNFIWTNFYNDNGGLTDEIADYAIYKLNK